MVQQILHGQLWRICVRCIRGRDLLWDRETASYIDRIKNLHVSKNFLLLPVLKPIQANTARELLNFIFSVSDLLHAHAQYLALIIWFLYPLIIPDSRWGAASAWGRGVPELPRGAGASMVTRHPPPGAAGAQWTWGPGRTQPPPGHPEHPCQTWDQVDMHCS